AIQGNLDPGRLLAGKAEIVTATQRVIDAVPRDRSHVFNLGHGILKETDPEAVNQLLETIRG
ncbi:MAG: uroporphyrinogen decarboxylase, partial [Rhodospirillaceae bacterium]